MGQSPPSRTYNAEGIGLPFFQGKAEFGELYPTAVKWCSEPKKIAEPDDVLISVRAPVGATNLSRERSCIGRGLAAIRPHGTMTSKYFLYALRLLRQELEEKGTGTTFKAVSGTVLKKQQIPLAPLAEQTRIIAEIEKQFTRLDYAVAALGRLQANLKRYKAAVLKAACEGRLVPQDPSDEDAEVLLGRILAERRRKWEEQEWEKLVEKARKKAAQAKRKAAGKPARISDLAAEEWQDLPETEYGRYLPKNEKWKEKYKEPERPDTSELPELPAGWVWTTPDQCFTVQRGRFSIRPRNDPRYYGGSHPFVQIGDLPRSGGNVTSFSQTLNDDGLTVSRKFPRGTVLIAIVGATIGNTGVLTFDSCCPDSLVAFQADNSTRLSFLELYLRSRKLAIRGDSYASGGQPNINLAYLLPYPVPLPPIGTQKDIVDEIDLRFSFVESLEEGVNANLARAERLRQAILQKAFNGQLVPQDPDDETASVLLERIRGQQEKKKSKSKNQRERNESARQPRML